MSPKKPNLQLVFEAIFFLREVYYIYIYLIHVHVLNSIYIYTCNKIELVSCVGVGYGEIINPSSSCVLFD